MVKNFPFAKFLLMSGGIGILLFTSCLNPIGFSGTDFKLEINTKVSGEIDTNTRIIDNAVLWVINKTNSVDLTSLTIKREDNPEGYPMTLTAPEHGTSVASYHEFTDKFYTVNLAWVGTAAAVSSDFSDAVPDNNSYELKMQMPRAQDYVIYIFRDKEGNIKVIQGGVNVNGQLVINNEIWGFDSNGNFVNLTTNIKIEVSLKDNTTPPGPPTTNVSPLVIRNVTKTADITGVKFGPSLTFGNNSGPNHGGQKLFKLEPDAYPTTVNYKGAQGVKGAPASPGTAQYNDVVIIDYTNNAQAWHTLYMYFYRTKTGEYNLSPSWPPVPNDASEENSIEDTLSENEGILQIINKSESATPLAGIEINGREMLASGLMLLKDDAINFIISPVGISEVKFKPKGKADYGFGIKRDITPRKTTTVAYYDSLWAIDDIPPDEGYGSGLVKVVNNTTGSVVSAAVIDKANPTKTLGISSDDFRPDLPISYGNTGYIPVVGTSSVEITRGSSYLVQLSVETENDIITIERLANPLYKTMVTIVLNQSDLTDGTARHGANVTVTNNSSASITSIEVYNRDAPNTYAVINEGNFTPAGSIGSGRNATFWIYSTQTLSIAEGAEYEAFVTVVGNNQTARIKKEFQSDGKLYDTTNRTITVSESDLPDGLKFVPLTGITITDNTLRAERSNDGNSWTFKADPMVLSEKAVITPTGASVKGPIAWAASTGDWDYAELNNGTLTMNTTRDDVVKIAQNGEITQTVTVTATIQGAGAGKAAISKDITITLKYTRGTTTEPVRDINLSGGDTITITQGQTLDLSDRVSFNPDNANINGTPISKSNLTWSVTSNPNNLVTLSGANVTGTVTGATTDQSAKITVSLPSTYNGTGGTISKVITVVVKGVPITYKTLSIVRTPKSSDKITAVLLRPIPRGNYSTTVLETGLSGERWNFWNKTFKVKNKAELKARYPGDWLEYSCKLTKDGEAFNVSLPANSTYQVFVVEGDSVIRSYCDPGSLEPKIEADKFFVLDMEKAKGNTTIGGKPYVVVRYETYNNLMYYKN